MRQVAHVNVDHVLRKPATATGSAAVVAMAAGSIAALAAAGTAVPVAAVVEIVAVVAGKSLK